MLALKEKRSKHGSSSRSSLAAERQTTGHEVEGDTEPTLPVQAWSSSRRAIGASTAQPCIHDGIGISEPATTVSQCAKPDTRRPPFLCDREPVFAADRMPAEDNQGA